MSEELAAPTTGAEAPAPASAPVVTPEQAQPEAIQTEAASGADPGREKAKERLSMRFSELTSQREAARQDAERARQEAEYWRQQAQLQPADMDAYDDGQQYDRGTVDRAVQEAIAADRMAQKVESLRATLFESGLDGAAIIASGGDVPFTEAMFDALTVSEHPALIADHLGRNPAEAGRIARLTPAQQGIELARLEARLASQPRTTNAPPPPAMVGQRAEASVNPNSMSFEQYKAAREAGKL